MLPASILGMYRNPKVGSESVVEKPNRTVPTSKETESRVSVAFKTEIKQPQFVQCLFNDGVILMIKIYITDGYVYDRL